MSYKNEENFYAWLNMANAYKMLSWVDGNLAVY